MMDAPTLPWMRLVLVAAAAVQPGTAGLLLAGDGAQGKHPPARRRAFGPVRAQSCMIF